jgi:hypothetical protein
MPMLDLIVAATVTKGGTDTLIIPSWDWALDKAADGIMGAVAGAVLKEIIGPTPWERDVTDKLSTIIVKLDEILREIKALQKYITAEGRQRWIEVFQAGLLGRIGDIRDSIETIRDNGQLNEEDNLQLRDSTTRLKALIGDISNYTGASGEPLGLPLFAAIAAAVPMLVVGQKILGVSATATNKDLARWQSVFQTWSSILQQRAKELIDQTTPMEASLLNLPHAGFVSWTGRYGEDYLTAGPDGGAPDFICYAEGRITGGIDDDFVVDGLEIIPLGHLPDLINNLNSEFYKAPRTLFPALPDSFAGWGPTQPLTAGGNGTIVTLDAARRRLQIVVDRYNQSRFEILERWTLIRQTQGVAQEMLNEIDRFSGCCQSKANSSLHDGRRSLRAAA